MKSFLRALAGVSLLAPLAPIAACSASLDQDETSAEARGNPILDGSPATAFPEAAIINMSKGGTVVAACSGAVIAPNVVLTAGHCVAGFDGWKVTTPFASGQTAVASSAFTNYVPTGDQVNAQSVDIGLIFLSSPITLATYPQIAASPVGDGTQVFNIGRIRNGVLSSSQLFVSTPVAVSSAQGIGFANDYRALNKIEPGDSGGPDIVTGTHTIVAVNSGAGNNVEVLARVDVVASLIAEQIAAHGGSGTPPAPAATTPPPPPTSTAPAPAPAPSATTPPVVASCVHPTCDTGGALVATCDSCASRICQFDPFCCKTEWDAICVNEANRFCANPCGGLQRTKGPWAIQLKGR